MNKFWHWYNRLNEPWRFILCLILCTPLYFLATGSPWAIIGTILLSLLIITKIIYED